MTRWTRSAQGAALAAAVFASAPVSALAHDDLAPAVMPPVMPPVMPIVADEGWSGDGWGRDAWGEDWGRHWSEPERRWGPRLPTPVRRLTRDEAFWVYPEMSIIRLAPNAAATITGPGLSTSFAYYGELPFGLPSYLPKAQITLSGPTPSVSLPRDPSFGSVLDALRGSDLPEGKARIDVAGHWAAARYDADAEVLSLKVPLIGVDRDYDARTGADVERIVRRLWRRHRSTIETAYLQWSAATRRDDPVAGNPWSTMTLMATTSVKSFMYTTAMADGGGRPVVFFRGGSGPDDLGAPAPVAYSMTGSAGPVGGGIAEHGAVRGGGVPRGADASGFSGTASGAIPLGGGGAHVVFSAPVSWAATGGAERLNGAASVGLLSEILPDWTLGLMAQGGVGAQSAAGAAWVAGGSFASRFAVDAGPAVLNLTNSISSLSTLPFEAAGHRIDYSLSNIALRNAVSAERAFREPDGIRPSDLFGFELSETRFMGDALYIERSWEAAVTWRRVDPTLGEIAAARVSALTTDAGDTGARFSLDIAF